MAIEHKSTIQYEQGGVILSQTVTSSGSNEINVDESIPDSSTDLQVTMNIDVSVLKSLYIESDQNITIETNNGTTPTDTLTLVANEPVIWTTNSVHSNPLTADITTDIFITNSSGSAANLKWRALQDATP